MLSYREEPGKNLVSVDISKKDGYNTLVSFFISSSAYRETMNIYTRRLYLRKSNAYQFS